MLSVGALGLIGSAALLKFAPVPFVWCFLLWSGIFSLLSWKSRSVATSAAFFNLVVVTTFFAIAETYFWNKQVALTQDAAEKREYRMEGKVVDAYRDLNHAVLGYAPIKGAVADARRYYGNELIYDVVYTIDSDGLRQPPPVDPVNLHGCILFFGGSFTFGNGVEDQETMPYRVGVLTSGRYRIFNFGFSGYGAHQMLAALESGMVADIVDCNVRFVVYQALDRHVLRSAGLVEWGENTPRFVLNDDGTVRRNGTLEDRPTTSRLMDKVSFQLSKSHLYSLIEGRSMARIRDEHFDVFSGIVQQARDIVRTNYPQAEFHVVFWDIAHGISNRIVPDLSARGIQLHMVLDNILPRAERRTAYDLGPHDHHPNPAAHDLIARYVVRNIIDAAQGDAE
jgi:hypothetical protein